MLALPIITPLEGSDHIWRLVYDYQSISLGVKINIRAGFLFDGLSIPRVFWRIVGHPLMGRSLPAGLNHDALYASHLADREMSDMIFYDLLARNSVPWAKRWTVFYAVRICGGIAWTRNSKDIKSAREYVRIQKEQ